MPHSMRLVTEIEISSLLVFYYRNSHAHSLHEEGRVSVGQRENLQGNCRRALVLLLYSPPSEPRSTIYNALYFFSFLFYLCRSVSMFDMYFHTVYQLCSLLGNVNTKYSQRNPLIPE